MKNQENNTNESDYIIIPNPIYDVVFRYLMEDLESATIILSTLINEKITKLYFEPLSHAEKNNKETDTEFSENIKDPDSINIKDPKSEKDIKLFHLDFTAIVELPDGAEELIMIELQKASEPDDIFRFKRYISKNFQRKQEKEIIDHKTQAVEKVNKPIRLIPVFILNFRIENEINDLLIKTNRIKTGIFKNKELKIHNEFIDNLSFDIWVVQLPNLRNIEKTGEYQNDEYKRKLFALLKLFDQKSRVKNNDHRLRLIKNFFPGFLDRVINRLQSADIDNQDLEEQMHAEDEYLQALIKRDNKISFIEQKLENTEQKLEIEKKLSNEKEKALYEKDKVLDEKDKIIYDFAKTLKENGVSTEIIQQKTNLSKEEIDKL